jgi:putative ABC transport system ATP-binding protein
MTDMSEPVAGLEGVSRDFFDGRQVRRVLSTVDVWIFPGELTILAGPSGSGKTTILSILGLILRPTEGKVFVRGEDVTDWNEDRLATARLRSFGFVFQTAAVIPALSVEENVLIASVVQGGRVTADLRRRCAEILGTLGLSAYARLRSQQLSTGQKQRVAIARSLINDPVLLLCDEPTSALDVESAAGVLKTLKELSRGARGVVLVTHDPRVFPFADRLIKVENGAIAYDTRRPGDMGGNP